MLHEVLLSLWGCTTNVVQIIDTDFLETEKILHPGEQALIKKILGIAEECNAVRNFINAHTSVIGAPNDATGNLKWGLYLQALCDGMEQAIQPFREDVIELEKIVLNDAYTPLTFILSRIQKYLCLFSVLNSIISEIRTQKVHGCKVLQYLHQHMHTGVPEVRQALEKMMYCCHVVFYKQLSSWLLYGILEDVHNEFFIQRASEPQDSLVLAKSKDSSGIADEKSSKNLCADMWDYEIKIHVLPSYIRPSLALKILTIGQTIIMFGNDPRQKKDLSIFTKAENSIWGAKEYEHFHELQNLKNKRTFDIIEFERTVDELKQCVTEHLWRVAVEEAQLMHQIKLIKDFFLLGRGELFLEFIRLAGHILNKKPTSHTTRDINLSFQIAARKMLLHDESTTESFDFLVPVPEIENEVGEDPEDGEFSRREREDPIDTRGWGLIQLQYKVVWPLHLLFSPMALCDYNTLFRFLLRVKKTQINLQNLWSEHMRTKNVDIGVMQLRNNLMFVINNLQYYLQVDVLESQYTIMENTMKNTRNFEEIQKGHSVFLANIMSQTFLFQGSSDKVNPVNKLIKILLRLCDDFILQAPMWELGNLLVTEKEELKALADTLNSLMDWLTKTLNKVRAQPAGTHLAQLLLRLDFNRWFSGKS
ncbi:gamma-tubulin complex component 4 [Neodiprion pinetum]|uniref:gamma-tubulin complex component 4 n=1 Tax=Neodiprion pinetum TaxID=441929 RepID=UPI001EE054C6|nr:gamma-tubulin complex component 4 [Neodiprion pinetum]